MSKCRPKNQQLIEDIERDIRTEFIYTYTSNLNVFYNGGEYSKRDYVITMVVGEVWDRHQTEYLRRLIRKNSGTNIIGGCYKLSYSRNKYISMAFDEKIRK